MTESKASVFREARNDSMVALSHQFAVRLML